MNPIKLGRSKDEFEIGVSNLKMPLKTALNKDFLSDDGFVKEGVTTYEAISTLAGSNDGNKLKILELKANFERNGENQSIIADTFLVNGEKYIKFEVEWAASVVVSGVGSVVKFKQALYTTVKLPENEDDISLALKTAYEGVRCYELSQKKLITQKTSHNAAQIEELKHQGTIFFKPKKKPVKNESQQTTKRNMETTYFKATIQNLTSKQTNGKLKEIVSFNLIPINSQEKPVLRGMSLPSLVVQTLQKPRVLEKAPKKRESLSSERLENPREIINNFEQIHQRNIKNLTEIVLSLDTEVNDENYEKLKAIKEDILKFEKSIMDIPFLNDDRNRFLIKVREQISIIESYLKV